MDDKALEATLAAMVHEVWTGPNRDTLSVNTVRKLAEDKHGLDDGFFSSAEWKGRSKTVIKTKVVRVTAANSGVYVFVLLTDMICVQDELMAAEDGTAPSGSKPAEEPEPEEEEEEKEKEKPKPKRAQKNGTKNTTKAAPKKTKPAPKPAPKKRQRKPKDESDESELSDLAESSPADVSDDDEDDFDEEEAKPKKKKQPPPKKGKAAPRGRKRKAVSDEEDASEASEPEAKKAKPRGRPKKVVESDDKVEDDNVSEVADGIEVSTTLAKEDSPVKKEESPLSDVPASDVEASKSTLVAEAAKKEKDDESSELSSVIDDEPPPPKKKRKSKEPPVPKKTKPAKEDKDGNNSDSSLSSVVIDDPPPKKRGRKSKEPAADGGGGSKKKVRKSTSGDQDVSPDDAEIKKLQGQLGKCGVRKIWGIELRKYGDDTRARIGHLRDLLKEIGMDGRFSEAKAREIKERRELALELEAVNEMNDLWGKGSTRRTRGAAPKKSLAESGDDDDEDGADGGDDMKGDNLTGGAANEDDGEDSDGPKGNARRRKVRPELAFLGDDDSDSD